MILIMLMLLLPILCGIVLLKAANRPAPSSGAPKLRLVKSLAWIMIGLSSLCLLALLVLAMLAA